MNNIFTVSDQAEKMWFECEYCSGDVDDRPFLDSKEWYIDENGFLTNGDEIIRQLDFCPCCGRPMSANSVEMIMKRLEALHEDR